MSVTSFAGPSVRPLAQTRLRVPSTERPPVRSHDRAQTVAKPIAAGGGVGPTSLLARACRALTAWIQNLWRRLGGGEPSDEKFVRDLYLRILGREADPEGLRGYVEALRNGTPRTAIEQALLASPEYQQRLAAPRPSPAPGTDPTRDALDLNQVTFAKGANIASWPVTNTLRGVTLDRDRNTLTVDHAKAGQWPILPFFDDPEATVEGNIWFFANIGGQWYGGAGEWLRPGQTTKQVDLAQLGPDQFYDTEPLKSWIPRSGELVGFAVSTPARAGQWGEAERSNVILVRWP